MSSRIEELAATLSPPKRGRVYAVATSTTTARLDLDVTVAGVQRYWRNRMLTIQVEGADLAIALVEAADAVITPADAGADSLPHASSCAVIPAGQERTYWVENEGNSFRWLAFRTVSGTGTVRIFASSPKEKSGPG